MAINRTALSLSSQVPDGDVFKSVSRGFQSFLQIQRTIESSSFRNNVHCPAPTGIDRTLEHNKSKLHTLRREIEKKRDESYQKYIDSTIRHRRLLQLNTLKKRLVNSLNKNVGQVKVKSLDELSGAQLCYEYYGSVLDARGCKPEPRIGQTCVSINGNIFVMGGHNSTPLARIWMLNPRQMEWKPLESGQLTKSGHSILMYKNNFAVVFGGASFYNHFTHERERDNNVSYFYDIETGIPKQVKTLNSHLIEPRKDHSSIVLGRRMLVFGGSSVRQKPLKDLLSLDFKTMKWTNLEYHFGSDSVRNFLQSGLTNAALGSYFKNQSTAKLASVTYSDQEGLYVFGGVNGQGQPNRLLHIRLNKRVPVMYRINPEGAPPSHISPQVLSYGEDSFLILSGDRSLRSLFMYKVLQNRYVKIECGGNDVRLGGVGSSLVQVQDKYYILFGLGDDGFNSTVVEFQVKSKRLGRYRKGRAISLQRLESRVVSVLSDKESDI